MADIYAFGTSSTSTGEDTTKGVGDALVTRRFLCLCVLAVCCDNIDHINPRRLDTASDELLFQIVCIAIHKSTFLRYGLLGGPEHLEPH